MLKLSVFTPHTNAALRTMLSSVFDENEIAIIEGDAQMAAAFSSLPFDHLLFTGSTMVGKLVMAAAAPQLTPVPLVLVVIRQCRVAPDLAVDNQVARLNFGMRR
ncbi:coniferyl aldehyde dehydrogenase, partial [Limimaricola sp. G21655-S1]|nr:coniferyl aldehyde dehydrogenase [Limimaricola sp. G21655-S1]